MSSSKMVNIANKLGKILGNDVSKYEEAMKNRLKQELQKELDVEFEDKNDSQEDPTDEWLGWEEDTEDKKPLKMREKKNLREKEKQRTLQRRKQRERKITYYSNDGELPLYGYEEDWE